MRTPGTPNRHPIGMVVGKREPLQDGLSLPPPDQARLTEKVDELSILPVRRQVLFAACHGYGPARTLEALRTLYAEAFGCRLPLVERGVCGCRRCTRMRRLGRGWAGRPFSTWDVTQGRPAYAPTSLVAFIDTIDVIEDLVKGG